MVERLHTIQERDTTGRLETYRHDVALRGSDHHALDPCFALVVPDIASRELHARTGKRDVECPRVGRVGEKEPHDLTVPNGQLIPRLAVDEEHVSEPPHERVGRRLS